MKKSILKNIILMMLLFLSIFSSSNIVFATGDQSVSGIIEGGSSFINDGEKQTSPITTDKTQELTNDLYNILFFVGLVLAVIIGIILGIQFMTGSVEQKAKSKRCISTIYCWVYNYIWSIWHMEISSYNTKGYIKLIL